MKYPYQYSGVEFSLYISVYIAGKDHEFLGDVFVIGFWGPYFIKYLYVSYFKLLLCKKSCKKPCRL